MTGTLSFIGGIHGVGKSTICTDICQKTGLTYLSASELIKWKEINNDPLNKKVLNIRGTQDRLIMGLQHAMHEGNDYLLDGHYCLLDSKGTITSVPIETFESMKPASLHLITGDILQIKRRLEARDGKVYDAKMLECMQQSELEYARHVSTVLRVELAIGTQVDYTEIITLIKRVHWT